MEFALVLPLLLLLLLGIVDLAKAYNYWNDSTNLANTAARIAAVGTAPGGPGTLKTYIRDQAPTPELKANITATGVVICRPASAPAVAAAQTYKVGEPITVRVNSTYTYLPFITAKAGLGTVQMKGEATTRIEQTGLVPPDTTGTAAAPTLPTCP